MSRPKKADALAAMRAKMLAAIESRGFQVEPTVIVSAKAATDPPMLERAMAQSRSTEAEIPKGVRVAWKEHPKQGEFLACNDYEVLYGGAVGGGKSDALLVDGWGLTYGAHKNEHHRAIIFRRSYPELRELIDRARELFPMLVPGVKYNQQDHRFTAPSGATFEFAYLQNDGDRFKYKRAWNWIGFDELTLWPTSTCYTYLLTRNRNVYGLPNYIRATTNPDGPGQKWVMERWGIDIEGRPVRRLLSVRQEVQVNPGVFEEREVQIARQFIPAKLKDNPSLRGTGYDGLLRLQEDPEVVEALLEGRWIGNRIKGAIYINQMQLARKENRVGRVPYIPGYPVNTFWDLGVGDTTTIWFHQQVGPENRFFFCTENSGVGIEYYAELLQTEAHQRKLVYGKHYLPHDAAHRSLAAKGAKTIAQVLEEMMPNERFEVVPVVASLAVGIQKTRAAMVTCLFDQAGCSDGIAALDAYHYEYDSKLNVYKDDPKHDWASHYADALRQFAQGYEPVFEVIENAKAKWRAEVERELDTQRHPATA
ncbi:MAG TPA: hypothetical protein VLE97_01930 [Gaiellaceae bacterium]|nr:hypothetical protein [Gaiellaceae bacterium]